MWFEIFDSCVVNDLAKVKEKIILDKKILNLASKENLTSTYKTKQTIFFNIKNISYL
jgi:hypothetical protein